MKLGVSSYSYSKHFRQTGENYFQVCDRAKKTGFSGIEFIDLSLEIQPSQSLMTLAQDIREHCEKIGLSVIAYTVSADFLKSDDSSGEIGRLKDCIDIASCLGAGLLRHDGTWMREGNWREAVRKLAPSVREVTEYAAQKGIRTCTENHGYFLQDSNRVEELILAVDHPNYGWLVDIGNFACADEDSVHALEIAAPYAFHVHAKDFLIKKNCQKPGSQWFPTRSGNWLRGTVPGHGVIPIASCVGILRRSGYDGWLSYEFEGMEENLPAIEDGFSYLSSLI